MKSPKCSRSQPTRSSGTGSWRRRGWDESCESSEQAVSDERWREVSRLYHHAAALAAADRPAYLRQVCAGDEALRSEIESLLIENSRVERLLGPEHSRMDFIGRRIGVYEIRSLLGAGGMGEVYRARDTGSARRRD